MHGYVSKNLPPSAQGAKCVTCGETADLFGGPSLGPPLSPCHSGQPLVPRRGTEMVIQHPGPSAQCLCPAWVMAVPPNPHF